MTFTTPFRGNLPQPDCRGGIELESGGDNAANSARGQTKSLPLSQPQTTCSIRTPGPDRSLSQYKSTSNVGSLVQGNHCPSSTTSSSTMRVLTGHRRLLVKGKTCSGKKLTGLVRIEQWYQLEYQRIRAGRSQSWRGVLSVRVVGRYLILRLITNIVIFHVSISVISVPYTRELSQRSYEEKENCFF